MAASIRDELGIAAILIEGNNGIFDVIVDDKIIFSKHETERFPDHDEVIDLLREHI